MSEDRRVDGITWDGIGYTVDKTPETDVEFDLAWEAGSQQIAAASLRQRLLEANQEPLDLTVIPVTLYKAQLKS